MPNLIGTNANQVSTNGMLGTAAFLDTTPAQELATGAAIASAATVNLDTATGNRVHVTGTATITAVTLTRGPRTLIFDGVLTLTHNATTNNLPGAVNITTAVGDRAIYESDGTIVYCVSYIRANGLPVVIASIVQPLSRRAFITASTTHTIPVGVTSARAYAVGSGAAATITASGGGGGMAYGDISVVAGDVLTVNIVTGIATVVKGGVTMLTANPASGVTAGTASINAAVTNGGAFSGGAGLTTAQAGGASSGSPLGAGVAGSGNGANPYGGSGWGGASISSGGGGGVGGAGVNGLGGPGLSFPSFDPILVGLDAASGGASTNPGGLGGGGGPNGAGGFGGGGGSTSRGGFGGGGGGSTATGGSGGFGGGGGAATTTGGPSGGAAVLIFY